MANASGWKIKELMPKDTLEFVALLHPPLVHLQVKIKTKVHYYNTKNITLNTQFFRSG